MSQICSCPVDLYDFQHHTWYSQIKETNSKVEDTSTALGNNVHGAPKKGENGGLP